MKPFQLKPKPYTDVRNGFFGYRVSDAWQTITLTLL